ncbi:MAG TPA: TlpA disulfide reductase family protein [Candidatus Binataceae bacterium]|nr:TlpA disulfide reductase family protein [Candidatus Binataceae bacterium]
MSALLVAVAILIGPMPSRSATNRVATVGASYETIDFTLRDLNGNETKLSQYRGHPVVIDFWATWCPPCRHQIPELKKLYSKYHKSKGLVVLGVACDTIRGEGAVSVRPFVKEFAISYPILLAEQPVVESFDVEAIPTTIFLGPDGKIVGRMMGAGKPGELSRGVESLVMNPGGKSQKKLSPEQEKKENLYNIDYVK